ncbi:peptidase M23, partial [Neisseria gonorrhoeae]
PLYIGSTKFILVIAGIPDLSKEAFVTLVRILYRRYSNRV